MYNVRFKAKIIDLFLDQTIAFPGGDTGGIYVNYNGEEIKIPFTNMQKLTRKVFGAI
ncbi:hypothetical protein H9661_06030 [Clostridium sp. Sa3CVN1]|uniref:Uncharacterized protein n=1 Tax=Clostridium cibarium TaxID=2762247 RepID=A0ABR8PRV6_9CLOT|nr:hypothetical protein [Clostridium cibarium]